MELSDIINHHGEEREHYLNAVAPPIFQTSNFSFKDVAAMREGLKHELTAPFYTRGYNPTVAMLRKKLAALAGADDALVFASGSAAVAAAVMSEVKAGDHVVCVQKPYSWTNKLLNNMLVNYGVENTMVDGTSVASIEEAIRPNTKLIYLETPNSLTFELQDIKAVVKLAKSKGITTAIDNSYSTPLYQKPIEMGIDISVHSASKYLNGHSDIIAGALMADQERIDRIFASEFMTLGGIISPNDAWLMLRGLRTLEIRLERSNQSTKEVVAYLEEAAGIEKVLYPFSNHHPQKALAEQQMKAGGGLFSILLDAPDIAAVERFCNHLHYFQMACSWGGYESLQFPMCALHGSQNYASELPWNLVRLYVGLEDPKAIIEDLKGGLNAMLYPKQ